MPVPAAEPLVSPWRMRFDNSAPQGMPAHVTALSPFLDAARLTSAVLEELRSLCAALPALEVEFRGTGRFPGVLYLDPTPAEGLRRVTRAIARQWPEAQPYGGAFAEVIPHLTVAHSVNEDVLAEVEAEIQPGLPFGARLAEARVCVFDGSCWRLGEQLPFGASAGLEATGG